MDSDCISGEALYGNEVNKQRKPMVPKLANESQEMEPGKKAIVISAAFISLLAVICDGNFTFSSEYSTKIVTVFIKYFIIQVLYLHIPYYLIKKTSTKADEIGLFGWIVILLTFSVIVSIIFFVVIAYF